MMSPLRQLLHILRKDLLHARWIIAGWLLLIVWDMALRVRDTGLWASNIPELTRSTQSSWNYFMALVGMVVIASWIVHDDAVPGTQAFWLTRPIARWPMFASKVVALLLIVVVPGLILQTLLMLAWGVHNPGDLLHANLELLFMSLTGLTLIFAAAAFTRHMGEMLVFIGAVTALTMLLVTVVFPLIRDWIAPDPLPVTLLWGGLPLNVTFGLAGLIVAPAVGAWALYRTRNWPVIVGVTLAVFLLVVVPLPKLAARASMLDAASLARTTVTEPWAASDRVSVHALLNEARWPTPAALAGESDIAVAAPVILEGLPPNDIASPYVYDATWTVDGETLSGGYQGLSQGIDTKGRPVRRSQMQREGSARLLVESGPGAYEDWPVLMTMPARTARRLVGRAGRYAATVTYRVRRRDPLGTQPLRAGISQTDGSQRIEIAATGGQSTGCDVDLRYVELEFLWNAERRPQLGFRVEDAQGHVLPLLRGYGRNWRQFTLFPFSPHTALAPLRVNRDTISIPRDLDAKASPCADLRWTAVSTTNVGLITRRLEIPDVVLVPQPQPALQQR